jgi:hypothetical protein
LAIVAGGALVACASNVPDTRPFEKGLKLDVSLASTRVREGETTDLALRLSNISTAPLDACVAEGWTYHVFGTKRDAGHASVIDHPGCVRRFSLKPGESLEWAMPITIGEVGPGPARLFASVQISLLKGCHELYGCYSTHVSAHYIAIDVEGPPLGASL